ncbi:DNA gyrase C-terminal beta-propeller domain-containing protein, partial [Motilibacter deserti]|nr:hypothetical protein [Motilibacter deserti]
GDERRTQVVAAEGEMSMEDLIAEEPVVVTITRGGYAKRTQVQLYRSQRRGGRGVRGAQLREDDIVEHFFVTTTHHWILFFTNKGRVYRVKAYELPESARDARGQHVANLLAFQPDERIAQVLDLRDYDVAPYLVLATKSGMVKKTKLGEYDSPRAGGVIAINLRSDESGDDELVSAALASADDDLLLVSRGAQAVRFRNEDAALRPMGRATSGVTGMRFREDDELLSMSVVREGADAYVLTATEGGYAKRTPVAEYRVQGRGGLGLRAHRVTEERGSLVGALVVDETDEVFAITSGGTVIRTRIADVRSTGRDSMGVTLVSLGKSETVLSIARNAEAEAEDEEELEAAVERAEEEAGTAGAAPAPAETGDADASATPGAAAQGTVADGEPDTAPEDAEPDTAASRSDQPADSSGAQSEDGGE